jgi:Fur family ferric uptake transcriptional regulator
MAAVHPWREHTDRALREAGFRAGGARAAVLDLMSRQDCCSSAQEIHASLRASGRSVGIASVYRVLEMLAELRLVQRVDVGDGIARFEPASPGGEHHHHVVCDDCGKVEPFSDPSLERAIASASGRLGYSVDAHEVVLRGECGDCRQPDVATSKPT